MCVVLKKRDKLIETADGIRKPEAVDDQMLKALQADSNEMKEIITDIKEVVQSGKPPTPSVTKHIEIPKLESKQMDGIRVLGVAESIAETPREKNEHNVSEIYKMMTFMDIDCEITNIKRLGTYQEDKNRTILLRLTKTIIGG